MCIGHILVRTYTHTSVEILDNRGSITQKGGVIFEKKKTDTLEAVPNFYRTPIPKFYFEMLLFNWSRASGNFHCYPKMGKHF